MMMRQLLLFLSRTNYQKVHPLLRRQCHLHPGQSCIPESHIIKNLHRLLLTDFSNIINVLQGFSFETTDLQEFGWVITSLNLKGKIELMGHWR